MADNLNDLPKDLKKSLRSAALTQRDALPPDIRIEKSLAICDHGAGLEIEPGSIVSGFWPMRSEADIRPLMAALGERGARLCLPAIIDRETIVFRELVRGAALVEMGFGTHGPGPEAEELDPELMLMPLAAFDGKGNRIGYGGGFYDRAIERLRAAGRAPQLIGIAFACQETDAAPAEPHDVGLDAILTEDGLRSFTGGT
ncbi:5-formyltetrahydrofolate cyclo-ligase [Oricola sp.]|uniref:5-formyltetrahydrofolate cyclo-ligase n=1 Tax=Oricola sp. TaxID=1979950 RepID=UPI003BAC0FB8